MLNLLGLLFLSSLSELCLVADLFLAGLFLGRRHQETTNSTLNFACGGNLKCFFPYSFLTCLFLADSLFCR